jgi:hypothetical protein
MQPSVPQAWGGEGVLKGFFFFFNEYNILNSKIVVFLKEYFY